MPFEISVRLDRAELNQLKRELAGVKNGVPRAMSAAVNRSLTTGRTLISKSVRDVATIKAGDVKDAMKIKRASVANPKGSIRIDHKPISLSKFTISQKKPGVSARVWKGSGRTLYKHAFIATMRSGHKGVFRRVGRNRLPIKEIYGPTPEGLLRKRPALLESIKAAIGDAFRKNLESQVNRLLKRKKA